MFDIPKILKRAWHILWNYRILWVFGFILALTAGGSFTGFGNNSGRSGNTGDWRNFSDFHPEDFRRLWGQTPQQVFNLVIAVGVVLLFVILISAVIAAILRYIAETASIRMVDDYEQNGTKAGSRQGWQYGWSRSSWRLFLINLLVHVPVYILIVLLGLIGLMVYFATTGAGEAAMIASIIAGVGLAFLFIFLTALVMAVLLVIRIFAWRACVLEGTGVLESLRRGYALVRRDWQNVGLTWLVMLGLMIAWGIASIIIFFPLIIVCILTAVAGVIVAALPVLLAAGIASLLAPFPWFWIIGGVVGLPLFFVVTFAPMYLIGGWAKIFETSVWTLTYRELKALQTLAPVEKKPQKP